MKRLVITGNGGAALSALRAIRSTSKAHRITLISAEDCPAYSPVLTTYYLAGSIPYRRLFLCQRDFYRRHGVRAILGDRAVAVETQNQRVVLAGGEAVPYDELLIATGSTEDSSLCAVVHAPVLTVDDHVRTTDDGVGLRHSGLMALGAERPIAEVDRRAVNRQIERRRI